MAWRLLSSNRMKAIDVSQPQFQAPLKARVTFKTLSAQSTLNRRAGNEPAMAVRARSSAAVALGPAQARTPHLNYAMTRAVRAQVEQEISRLTQVRTAHVKHALELIARRNEDDNHSDGHLSDRAIDTVCRELMHELSHDLKTPPSVANSNFHGGGSLTREQAMAKSETRALHALRLIRKIDGFVKSQRPALSLTLNDSLAARVEIERVGPGQVALRVVGHRGPPSPEAVTRIREEMEAKGLKIAVLAVE